MRLWLFLAMSALLSSAVGPASAAVRRCGDIVVTAGEDRVSEANAKKKAMAAWIEKAAKLGPAYTAWQIAAGHQLSCLKLPDGTHRCQAIGRPCGITNVPDRLPPGTVPQAPAVPKKEQRI